MTPFQCKLCHFQNIDQWNPLTNHYIDQEALESFQRASLDAFWSRATSTVWGNSTEGKRGQGFAVAWAYLALSLKWDCLLSKILIDKQKDVDSDYGILRSSCQGMTAHARNLGCPLLFYCVTFLALLQ
jgi:hypothetical protein